MAIAIETEPISLANNDTFRTEKEDEWVQAMVEWISKTGARNATFTSFARGREKVAQGLGVMEVVSR